MWKDLGLAAVSSFGAGAGRAAVEHAAKSMGGSRDPLSEKRQLEKAAQEIDKGNLVGADKIIERLSKRGLTRQQLQLVLTSSQAQAMAQWARDESEGHRASLGPSLVGGPHQLFPSHKAEAAAKALKSGDPDWDYRVVHDPSGRGMSFIEIYDEEGEFVERWGGRRAPKGRRAPQGRRCCGNKREKELLSEIERLKGK